MRAWIDVGVNAQGHRRDLAQFRGNLREPLELVFGFHVETQHARLKRGAHFRYALADPGENGFRRAAPYGEDPRKLAAGNNIEARTEACEKVQYREIGVGLDRIADEDGASRTSLIELAVCELKRSARIDVARRAEALRDLDERHALRAQRAVPVRKKIHWRGAGLLSCFGSRSGVGR